MRKCIYCGNVSDPATLCADCSGKVITLPVVRIERYREPKNCAPARESAPIVLLPSVPTVRCP